MHTSRYPINEQIREYIHEKIRSGVWTPADQIPSERELSEQFGVSRNTIRQALMKLENEGLLHRAQGQGTFVSTPKIEMVEGELISITTLMHQQGRTPETIVTKLARETLNAHDAGELDYSIGEEVYVIQRIRKADGIKVVLENTKLPCKKVPGIDKYDLLNLSIFSIMADIYNYTELLVYQTIEAASATEEVATLLNIDTGAPVVVVNRLARDENNEVVEWARDFYPSDRVRFVYNSKINLRESQQKFRGSYQPKVVSE
jgi:GntR family transcriptional regulator